VTEVVWIEPPYLGWVKFMSYVPKYEFQARIGDTIANPTDGYGGWQVTSRPRARGLTEWNGANPMTIDIPILFDGWPDDSQEDAIKQLEMMAGWGGEGGEPPLLAFNSNGVIPHDQFNGPTHDWVISQLQWGDADRDRWGARVRQAVTVTVMEYVEDDVLSDESAAQRHKATKNAHRHKGRKPSTKHEPYVVKKGDTLPKIAKRRLGSSKRWREIAQLNKIRDPKAIKVGQHLKMP
jgi:hypothetical protein